MKSVKKLIALLLFVVILTTMMSSIALATVGGGAGRPVTGWATANLPRHGRVDVSSGNNLNVRSGPSTNHSVVGSLPKDRDITIIGPAENGFFPVYYNSTTSVGYVSASYILHPSPFDDNRAFMVVVSQGSTLNFRASAPSGTVLANAPNTARVPQFTTTITQSFRNVVYRGVGSGWMHQDHLGTPPAN